MLSGILVSPVFLCHEYFTHRTLWSPMHDFFCEVVVGQPWYIWWLANHQLCHGWPTTGWPTSNYVKLANLQLANYWLADLVGILSLHIWDFALLMVYVQSIFFAYFLNFIQISLRCLQGPYQYYAAQNSELMLISYIVKFSPSSSSFLMISKVTSLKKAVDAYIPV